MNQGNQNFPLDYQKIFEGLSGRYLILTPQFKIVDASDAYLEVSQKKRDQLIDQNIFEMFPDNPNDPNSTGGSTLRKSLQRVLQSKKPDRMPSIKYDVFRNEKYEEHWWSLVNSPVLDATGSVEVIIHAVDEITEHVRLQAMQEAEKEKARLAAIQTFSGGGEMGAMMRAKDWSKTPVGPVEAWPQSLKTAVSIMLENKFAMYLVWGDEYTQFYNDAYSEILQTKHPAALGISSKITFRESWESIGPLFKDAYLGKGVKFDDWGLPMERNGKLEDAYFTFSYSPIRVESGEVGGVLVTTTETTERMKNQLKVETERKKAKESEEQLRLIADRLPALISYMDLEKRYRFVNLAYSKWFGRSREEIEGKTRKELLEDDSTYEYTKPFEDQAFAGKAVSFELTLSKPNGDFVNLDTEYLPDISPETGKVRGMVGVGHDVTLRKKELQDAEESRIETERLAADLKAALNTRDEFMSIASHELKTPITSLQLQLQITKRRTKTEPQKLTPEKIAEVMNISLRQVDRLTSLVESLLDVARIRAGKIEYSASEFQVKVVISDVVERFCDQLEEASCSVKLDVPVDFTVSWDRFRMEQVLVNLISNAIKYAPGSPIYIHAEKSGDTAIIKIQDFGPGIPKERQKKIFERFERGVNSTNISGLGLGLFIVNQVVKGHRGSVTVESEPGRGTLFKVKLPVISPF